MVEGFEGWGAILRSLETGEQIGLPNGANLIDVRGSDDTVRGSGDSVRRSDVKVRVGLEMRIGAMMAYTDNSSD